jgi:hypothetical protein
MTETESRSAWQRVAAWVLVVLTAIAVAGSVVGFWVHRTVLDTDSFMGVVSPIVESESVRTVVSDRVGDELVGALDLETRLTERLQQAEARLLERLAEVLELPDAVVARLEGSRLGLDSLAPMIAAGVESRIREAVTTFVSSPEGTRLLLQTIETAHERSVLLLRDELDQLPNVVVSEGEVRLTFVPLMAEVLRSVINAGLDIIGIDRQIPAFDSAEDATAAVDRLAGVLGRDLSPDFGQVRLGSEAGLERAQGLVRAFDLALWVLIILAVLLGALAVWLAPSVPAGIVRVAVAATIAVLVGWLGVQLISNTVADAAATAEGRAAASDIVRALVSGLTGTALALALIGLGIVVAAVVAGRREPVPAVAGGGPGPAPSPMPPPSADVSAVAAAATEASGEAAKTAPSARAKPAPGAARQPSQAAGSTRTSKPSAETTDATANAPTPTPPKPKPTSRATKSSASRTKRRRSPPATGAS